METHDPAEIARAIETLERRWSTAGPHNLPYRILLLAKLIDRITTPHVRRTAGLSLAEWRAMAQIFELQPCSAAEIASRALIDRAEVSRSLNSLESRGFVQREANPKNRKSSLVSLTEEGMRINHAIRGERGKFYNEWLADLSEQDRTEIDEGLCAIARRIVEKMPSAIEI